MQDFRDIYFFLAENNPTRATHKIYKRVPMVLTVRLPKKIQYFIQRTVKSCEDHLHKQQRKISKSLIKRQFLQPVILLVGLHFEDIPTEYPLLGAGDGWDNTYSKGALST